MMAASFLFCLTILALTPVYVLSYSLLFMTADIGSHVIFLSQTAHLFKQRGHDVTLLLGSNVKLSGEVEGFNLSLIRFNNPLPVIADNPDFKEIAYNQAFHPSFQSTMKGFDLFLKVLPEGGKYMLEDSEAMAAIKAGRFDYIIVDPACGPYLLIPYKFNIPYAFLAADCFGHTRRIPIMPSYIPSPLSKYTDDMSFTERLINFILTVPMMLFIGGGEEISQKYVPERPVVGYMDLMANASLCLQLRENTIDFIKPEMPDVISMATIMGRPAKPLPSDLETYMDQSEHGAILVSFGSLISELPDDVLNKLLEGLRGLKQNVIFRYTGELNDVPANVKVMSWMPQNDLLGHPNLKLFVTHCGMNSLIEAIYHGVPMLAVPYFIDQHSNAVLMRAKDLGETMGLHDFSGGELKEKINKILTGEKYYKSVKNLSAIYRDIQASGKRDPIFWVEHVIKHGGEHLRSHAYKMPWYQYFMVDILSVILISVAALSVFGMVLCRCILRRVCCHKDTKKKME